MEDKIMADIKNNDKPDNNIVKGYIIHDEGYFYPDVDFDGKVFANSRKAAIELKHHLKKEYNIDCVITPIISDARLCMEFGGINPDAIRAYNNYTELLKTEGPARAGYRNELKGKSKDAIVAYNLLRMKAKKNPCSILEVRTRAEFIGRTIYELMYEKTGKKISFDAWTRKNAEIISSASNWDIFKACNYDKYLTSCYINAKIQKPINYLY